MVRLHRYGVPDSDVELKIFTSDNKDKILFGTDKQNISIPLEDARMLRRLLNTAFPVLEGLQS